jgi:hypothetical protein
MVHAIYPLPGQLFEEVYLAYLLIQWQCAGTLTNPLNFRSYNMQHHRSQLAHERLNWAAVYLWGYRTRFH